MAMLVWLGVGMSLAGVLKWAFWLRCSGRTRAVKRGLVAPSTRGVSPYAAEDDDEALARKLDAELNPYVHYLGQSSFMNGAPVYW
jgi:hypothetical protein